LQFSTYWSYVTHGSLVYGGIAVFFLIASYGVQVCGSLWLAAWGEAANDDEDDYTFLATELYYLHVYALLQVISIVFLSVCRLFIISHRYQMSTTFHSEMLENILKQRLPFFDITPVGKLLNRFTQDLVTIDDDLTLNIISTSDLLVKVLSAIGVIIAVTKGYMLVIVIPVLVLHRWTYQGFVYVNATLARLEAASRSPIFVHFTQSMVGLQSIRAYKNQSKFISKIERHIDNFSHVTILQQCALQWIVLRQSFLGSLIIFAVGVIAITFGTDFLPAEYFAIALSYAIQLSSYLKSYVRQTAATESQFVSVKRVQEYCELHSTDLDSYVAQDSVTSAEILQPIDKLNGTYGCSIAPALEFRNACLKYEYGPLALKGVSFVVQPGERLGVVGRTG
jgi:ABC-type multidrug transport system fused ATPase/permease subunit